MCPTGEIVYVVCRRSDGALLVEVVVGLVGAPSWRVFSVAAVHSADGGFTPPTVLTRWMNAVCASLSPPVGPNCCARDIEQQPLDRVRARRSSASLEPSALSSPTPRWYRPSAATWPGWRHPWSGFWLWKCVHDLFEAVVEQRGLRPDEQPVHAGRRRRRRADVVLRPDGMSLQKRLVVRWTSRFPGTAGGDDSLPACIAPPGRRRRREHRQ